MEFKHHGWPPWSQYRECKEQTFACSVLILILGRMVQGQDHAERCWQLEQTFLVVVMVVVITPRRNYASVFLLQFIFFAPVIHNRDNQKPTHIHWFNGRCCLCVILCNLHSQTVWGSISCKLSCKQYQSGIWIINIVASNDNRARQYGDHCGHGLMNSS